MSDEILAGELIARRDDPDEWAQEPEEVEVRTSRSEVVSFRMPSEELDSLVEATSKVGESLSEYIRKAIAVRLHGVAIGPAVQVTSGGSTLVVRSHIVTGGRTEAFGGFIPDNAPLIATVR
jgi:hypothetical protein